MASNYDPSIQQKLEAPMPLIGTYVALASLACSLSMAADLIHGFRSHKLWFPSKFFSLNATSLTLLSVALKLPTDLTTNMSAVTDRLAKISSLALMSTAMATSMPSLGSMTDRDILINVTALAILIITVVADVCIQVVGTRSFLHHRLLFPEEILALSFMLLLLLMIGSTAIMVLTTKKFLEAKYHEKRSLAASSRELSDTADNLRSAVKKYWVMAETSSPQFVIARSAASAASGFICLVNALILAQAIVRTVVAHSSLSLTDSSYGCSTKWILLAQTAGVIVGTVSTCFRWSIAVRFRCSGEVGRSLKQVFKVEDYWTRKLMEWQGSSIPTIITHRKCRRFVYNARGVVVDFICRSQIGVVVFNKLLLVISCFITAAFIKLIQNLKKRWISSDDCVQREVGHEFLQDVRRNSLRLEGEADLPEYMLQSIPKHVDQVLQAARRQKSGGLIEFLRGSNFKGVAEFDNHQVPSIHGKEPKNCWSLAVTTLTCIATALPNVQESKVDQLVRNVNDGLFFVKIVEQSFYKNEEWKNIRKAADFWLRVDLFRKWQEIDLAKICSSRNGNSRQALEILVEKSKIMASDLRTDIPDCPMFNPANWPPKTIAANSMYRMSTTILDACDEENPLTDEELFDRISAMIAGILAACLTNLGRVIAKKCHLKAIEDRERSVFEAARLLGKSEEIVDLLVLRDLPAGLNPDYAAAYIEEWRGAMFLEIEMSSDAITPSCNGTASSEGCGSCSSEAITLMEHLERSFQRRDLQL